MGIFAVPTTSRTDGMRLAHVMDYPSLPPQQHVHAPVPVVQPHLGDLAEAAA
jgi:hypothetical protein